MLWLVVVLTFSRKIIDGARLFLLQLPHAGLLRGAPTKPAECWSPPWRAPWDDPVPLWRSGQPFLLRAALLAAGLAEAISGALLVGPSAS